MYSMLISLNLNSTFQPLASIYFDLLGFTCSQVAAVNACGPPVQYEACASHAMLAANALLQPATINLRYPPSSSFSSLSSEIHAVTCSTTAAIDHPYPLLVLVGPARAGKRELRNRIIGDFGDKFAAWYAITLNLFFLCSHLFLQCERHHTRSPG